MTALYDRIGSDYDTTRSADPVVTQQLAKHLGLTTNQHYLDIGCGTGNYTQALSNLGGQWTGLEPSQQMLQQAQEKTSSISWVLSQAEQLPFAQASFDGAIITLAIHHFEDLGQAFRQVDRVLRSGSRLVLFTVTPEQVRHFWLKRYFSNMIEADAAQLPSSAQIDTARANTGLQLLEVEPFFITPDTADFFFYSGKYRPEIYLSEQVRQSMSPFRTLISEAELARGLSDLRQDINSGDITQIIADSETPIGDHCFMVFEKQLDPS